jgi:hypothetical protein
MTDKQKKRGGLRSPAGGRPPMEPSEHKVKLSITIAQTTRDWLLTQRQRPNEPLSQVIERELRRASSPAHQKPNIEEGAIMETFEIDG